MTLRYPEGLSIIGHLVNICAPIGAVRPPLPGDGTAALLSALATTRTIVGIARPNLEIRPFRCVEVVNGYDTGSSAFVVVLLGVPSHVPPTTAAIHVLVSFGASAIIHGPLAAGAKPAHPTDAIFAIVIGTEVDRASRNTTRKPSRAESVCRS